MKRILCALVVLMAVLTACKHSAKKINDNLTIVEDKDGDTIKEDDFLALTFTEKTDSGKLISGSSDYDIRPAMMFREKSYFKGDFFDMLGHLSEGDSAQFKISVDSIVAKTGRPRPAGVTGKYLFYNVRINKVVGRGTKNDSLYNVAIENERKEEREKAKAAEQSKIDSYISKHNLHPQKTASGLMYIVIQKGTGAMPVVKDSVLVNYTARTLTDRIFETTDSVVAKNEKIYRPKANYHPVILPVIKQEGPSGSGFMEAVGMFPKGTKVQLIIPSKLAYGEGNYKMLQPYTALVCELEIADIRQAAKK